MNFTNQTYILETGAKTEYRLSLLQQVYGKYTSKLFQKINFQKGMKVAIVGSGSGSGIEEIYEKIGKEGHILCIDSSFEQISLTKSTLYSKRIKNVDYIVKDIESLVGNGNYDVVYCRFVLIHVQNPMIALKNMLSLIKENGIIACEEYNYEDIFCYPHSDSIEKYKVLLGEVCNIYNIDYAYGKKIYYNMNSLNIEVLHIKQFNPLCTSYEEKLLMALSLMEEKKHFIMHNLIKQEEVEDMIKELEKILHNKLIIMGQGSVIQSIGVKRNK